MINVRCWVRVRVSRRFAVPISSTVPWRTLMIAVVRPLAAIYQSFLPTLNTRPIRSFLAAMDSLGAGADAFEVVVTAGGERDHDATLHLVLFRGGERREQLGRGVAGADDAGGADRRTASSVCRCWSFPRIGWWLGRGSSQV